MSQSDWGLSKNGFAPMYHFMLHTLQSTNEQAGCSELDMLMV